MNYFLHFFSAFTSETEFHFFNEKLQHVLFSLITNWRKFSHDQKIFSIFHLQKQMRWYCCSIFRRDNFCFYFFFLFFYFFFNFEIKILHMLALFSKILLFLWVTSVEDTQKKKKQKTFCKKEKHEQQTNPFKKHAQNLVKFFSNKKRKQNPQQKQKQ